MPQRIRDYGVAALALSAALGALAALDARVPRQLSALADDVASGRWLDARSPVGRVVAAVTTAPALDNVFVFALLLAGVVFVVLMVRT